MLLLRKLYNEPSLWSELSATIQHTVEVILLQPWQWWCQHLQDDHSSPKHHKYRHFLAKPNTENSQLKVVFFILLTIRICSSCSPVYDIEYHINHRSRKTSPNLLKMPLSVGNELINYNKQALKSQNIYIDWWHCLCFPEVHEYTSFYSLDVVLHHTVMTNIIQL